jgi:pimeloyl-ACP methyl ester carboxylesterase
LEGLEIFYREAGPRDAPTVLLLHGFPSSSHMFRNLIPLLADKYHVVAPDFPGYGESSAPSVNDFDYSFERLATVTEKFTEKLLDTGHFALEEEVDRIGSLMHEFLDRTINKK